MYEVKAASSADVQSYSMMTSKSAHNAGEHLSVAVVGLLFLQLDFSWIEKASYQRLPRWMEWYGAQSLMLTLVWMYMEVLRLLWMFAGGRRSD